jgi:hypothetical protein
MRAEEGRLTEVIITPEQYGRTSTYDLLTAAAQGLVGVDQRLLSAIVDRGEQAAGDIVRFALGERAADRINLEEDLLALVQYLGSPKTIPFLIEYLRRDPADPPEDVLHAFQRIGEPAIGPLIDLYNELGPEIGADIVFVLAALRHRDPRILTVLQQRADHDPGDAAFLMGVHGDPAARLILEKLVQRAAGDPEFAALIGGEAAESLKLLDEAIENEPPDPVSLWDLYPEHIEPVFEVLTPEEKLGFLRCPSAELRADAATSFIDREIPSEIEEALIELAENDPNVGVRSVACAALAEAANEERIEKLLLSKLGDTRLSPPERCGALLGLASKANRKPELGAYIEEFYANPATIARAVEAMWRSMDLRYAGVFKRHLNDADFDVRRQAIKGIGFAQIASEAPKLLDLFEDEEFRLDALFSYAMAAPVEKLTRGDMPQLMKKIEHLAGGLSDAEGEVVETALDTRLILNGLEPVFLHFHMDEERELGH